MAVRNVGRNKRRTLITIATIVLGTVVVIQVRGLINGLQGEMIKNLTRKVNGDLQIHKAGYKDNLDSNPFDYLVPFTDETEKELIPSGISNAAPRLRVFGLINDQRTQKTTPVFLTGIDPVREVKVCPRILDGIEKGSFLSQTQTPHQLSQEPAKEDLEDAPDLDSQPIVKKASSNKLRNNTTHHPVLLTPALARGLKAEIGDEMVIILKDSFNMEQAVIAIFAGTLEMNLPMSASKMVWIDLETLQNTLGVKNQASEIALKADEKLGLKTIQKNLTTKLGSQMIVERWDEVAGFFSDVMGLQNAVFKIVLAIMFVIVSSAIINTSMMTVSERVREIGTLMAIGYKRSHILSVFLIESATIGLLGGITGVTIGSSLVFLMRGLGLRFSFPGTRVPIVIEPFVTLDFVALVLFLSCISALVAALYPSYRASRLSPVKALSSH
ncbi:MAG: ABC transporter permease [Bacteriovoracia bacterium]